MMGDDFVDERPIAEANRFMFVTLDEVPNYLVLWREHIWPSWRDEHPMPEGDVRITIVSPEHPKPGYPDGWYVEGWEIAPRRMDPPHKAAPFNFPLTAGPTQ